MSVLGTICGLALGRALCAIVEWKSIVDLPADVYFLSRLPVEIRPMEWVRDLRGRDRAGRSFDAYGRAIG